MKNVLMAASALAMIAAPAFAQNTQTVNVTFLGWEGTAPLSVTLLVAAIAGLSREASPVRGRLPDVEELLGLNLAGAVADALSPDL